MLPCAFISTPTNSLQDPVTDVLEKLEITDPFINNWLNLLCFLLQGLPAGGTMTAVMAYMLADWCRPVSEHTLETYILSPSSLRTYVRPYRMAVLVSPSPMNSTHGVMQLARIGKRTRRESR